MFCCCSVCAVPVCGLFAVSLGSQALPGEEQENMFSVPTDSGSFCAGENISCVREAETVNICLSRLDCTWSIHLRCIYRASLLQKAYNEKLPWEKSIFLLLGRRCSVRCSEQLWQANAHSCCALVN